MKTNFKCPRCKTKQVIGKRLHASWTCPHCKNTIIPTRDIRRMGYVPFKKNAMYATQPGIHKFYSKKKFATNA